MAENVSPRKKKRASLQDAFPQLQISSPKQSSSSAGASIPDQSSSMLRMTSCLRGSFSHGWPPSVRTDAAAKIASSRLQTQSIASLWTITDMFEQ
jgi:hypothetical protein